MKKNIATTLFACIFFVGFSSSVYSATDMVLYLTDIEGESLVSGYENWIDILNWSWEIGIPNENSQYTRKTKADVNPIVFRKYLDKASPHIAFRIFTGELIEEAIFEVSKSGDSPFTYLKLTLQNVEITYVSSGGNSGDDRSTETLALDFGSICYEYVPQNEYGSPDTPIVECWSR